MADKGTKPKGGAQDTAPSTMTIEVLHPISYGDSEYTRGLHHLPRETAEYFLAIRVPNRVEGPQRVARLPVPAEEPKRGEVKRLVFED